MLTVRDAQLEEDFKDVDPIICPRCGRTIEFDEVCSCYEHEATLEECLAFIDEQYIEDKKLFYVDYCFRSSKGKISDTLYNICKTEIQKIKINRPEEILKVAKEYISTNLSWKEFKEWIEEQQ